MGKEFPWQSEPFSGNLNKHLWEVLDEEARIKELEKEQRKLQERLVEIDAELIKIYNA